MWIIPLLFLACGYAVVLFGMGRFLQPSHDRLRMRRLDNPALVQTLARGWATLTSNDSLERITDELGVRRRGPLG
ncbi:MAG: hypothetical protein L0I80_01880 [Brevibacterium sp.]|uniref:hypothetical protein n=1 Tax=Brevibacterium sp. TaxID=1701 RepID=UPI0026489913|nr:hypothetical protein [Brevibacterium sp.]MDN5834619.1 hypothetical protein [Brevibacterium sp.]MDN5875715.1 hypothetical protein [Brevibacterium sp.]MDN5908494.1 hypothetical protein [Brevibacterium sp.]MDN6122609.1 hypothetical protein [Brevibacterium sp.]MDN6158838.1 hypothetical protein [Brevibacterium sp.]